MILHPNVQPNVRNDKQSDFVCITIIIICIAYKPNSSSLYCVIMIKYKWENAFCNLELPKNTTHMFIIRWNGVYEHKQNIYRKFEPIENVI